PHASARYTRRRSPSVPENPDGYHLGVQERAIPPVGYTVHSWGRRGGSVLSSARPLRSRHAEILGRSPLNAGCCRHWMHRCRGSHLGELGLANRSALGSTPEQEEGRGGRARGDVERISRSETARRSRRPEVFAERVASDEV